MGSITIKTKEMEMWENGNSIFQKYEMISEFMNHWNFETLTPRNQETKKPRIHKLINQENKKPRNQETKKIEKATD